MTETLPIEFASGRLRFTPGTIGLLEINQTERHNAMSEAMWDAVPSALAEAQRTGARVIVLTGTGGRAFSSGADISEFAQVYATAGSAGRYNARVRAAQAALRDIALPVIAMINGLCLGGGCGLALASDLRFASEEASFAITPARLGLAYSYEDTAQLVEKVGPARAKDILFSGRRLLAREALDIGLIDRVCPPGELREATYAYANELAALSPASIAASKATINALTGPASPPADLLAMHAATFSGADFQEGYRAFLEKRKPRFGS